MTPKRNDSIFQLSLIELAFILLFVFVLLAGFSQPPESEENESPGLERVERTRLEVIQHEADRATSEQEIESALAFQKALSDVGGRPVSPEDKQYLLQLFEQKEKEGAIASEDERAPDSFSEALKQTNDLRGQIAYLQKRLDGAGAGLDHPPCWADRYGKIQYFLKVRILKNGLEVERAWPAQRDEDARSLPNFDLATDPQIKTDEAFRSHMNEIYQSSVREDCRHFVILTNTVYDDVWLFNEYRKTVERFFYVLDLT